MKVDVTDAQIEAARAAGQVALETEPHAEAAWYEVDRNLVWIKTTTGLYHGVPAERLQGLQDALPVEIEDIEVSPSGVGLHWPQLDVDLTVKGIMSGAYGSKSWMKEVAKQEKIRRSQSGSRTEASPTPIAMPTIQPAEVSLPNN